MAEEPEINLQDQLLEVAKSVVKVANTTISPLKCRRCDDVAVPQKILCPLFNVFMTDLLCSPNGQTHDRFAMENWLNSGKTNSHVSKEALSDSNVTPNHIA